MNLTYEGQNKVTVFRQTIPNMQVLIELEAYKKMHYIVDECDKEVGWLGVVDRQGDTFIIKDVFLFKQQTSSVTCEITPEGIADMVDEILQEPNGAELIEKLLLWGHSHVNMATLPSAQDEAQLMSFEENGNDWFLGLICNKKGSFNFTYIDYIKQIKVSDLKWKVLIPGLEDEELRKYIKTELDKKVAPMPVQTAWKPQNQNVIKPIKQDDRWEPFGRFGKGYNCYFDNYFEDTLDFNPYSSRDSVDNFDAFDKIRDEEDNVFGLTKEDKMEILDNEYYEFFEEMWISDEEKNIDDFHEFSKGLLSKRMAEHDLRFLFEYLTLVDYLNIYEEHIEPYEETPNGKTDDKSLKSLAGFYAKIYLQDKISQTTIAVKESEANKKGESFLEKFSKLAGRFIVDYICNNDNICGQYINHFYEENGFDV